MLRFALALLLAVATAQASVTVTRTSEDAPHPTAMEIEVQLPYTNKKVRVPLLRTEAFEDTPITVREAGVSRTFSARQAHHPDHAHYRDVATKSIVSVRHENGKKRMVGHVMHEGTSYFLAPEGEAGHRVTRNEAKQDDIEEQIDRKLRAKDKLMRALSRRRRQSISSSATDNTVELLLLLDHTVWAAFKAIYGTDDKCMQELHFYYTHIMNGLDTAFRNIPTPTISVKCVGMTIAKTEADSAWLPTVRTENDAGKILESIKAYVNGKPCDHAMAFTRTNIQSGGNFGVCGMAYVGGACGDSRESINEDQGLQSWGTAAHELAHNLASDHDNNEAECQQSSKFLMSPSAGSYDLSNVANSYRFSTCSVNYMKNFANSATSNCLRSSQGTQLASLAESQREGARLTLNQVCRLAYPESPGEFFKADDVMSNPALICAKIYCAPSAGSGSGVTGGGLRAPVGTSCGNKKSCNWNGQCTSDSAAPEADESCFWGDSWGSTCNGWRDYIQYMRSSNSLDQAKQYCGQCYSGCCHTLKTLCKF